MLKFMIARDFCVTESNSEGNDMHVVAAELYQLAEQVFRTCCVVPGARSFPQALATYVKGLEWYQSFFTYAQTCTGQELLTLFVQ